jgi:2-succinyl-5-enolpyruvyl-6-hydroxy-3-cyclohexene-1-carboxylate synthase
MSEETKVASAVLGELLRAGVKEYCVCSGARNLELVLLLREMDRKVKVFHFPEERCAGFFAVGRMQAAGQPVAVVTTSGTAVAELLPAMIEAHYQGLPLIAVTADRPSHYRRSGAPQVIDQVGLFGGYAEACLDWPEEGASVEAWSGLRPLHINVCLGEPGEALEGSLNAGKAALAGIEAGYFLPAVLPTNASSLSRFLEKAQRLVVLVGGLPMRDRETVIDFLVQLGAPVWAEASSNLREESRLQPLLLRGAERDWGRYPWKNVLRLGGVPSLRFWRDLEAMESEVDVFSVAPSGYPGLARKSEMLFGKVGDVLKSVVGISNGFSESVMAVDDASMETLEAALGEHPRSEVAMVRRVSELVPAAATVFLGNSLPIREWNLVASRNRGFAGGVFANRGANGIDGELSSFLGASAGADEAWGVFGDLTVLYDLAAPSVLRQLEHGHRRFVVVNNGGGKIFGRLPIVQDLDSDAKRLIENPHELSFEGWAAMWGMGYLQISGTDTMALEGAAEDVVIELRPDAEESEAFWAALELGELNSGRQE